MRNTVIETDLPGTPALSFCHKLQRSLGPDTAHTIPIHTFLSLLAGGLRCTTLHADSNDHRCDPRPRLPSALALPIQTTRAEPNCDYARGREWGCTVLLVLRNSPSKVGKRHSGEIVIGKRCSGKGCKGSLSALERGWSRNMSGG